MVDAELTRHQSAHLYAFEILIALQRGADVFLVVAHEYASADGFHTFVHVEGDEHVLYGIAVQRGVGVEVNDIFSCGDACAEVGGRGFTAAHVATQIFGDVFRALQIVADEWRVVVGAVVDDEDLEVLIGLLTQCGDQLIDIFSLVLAWHEYRHQRAVVVEKPPRQRTSTMAAITCEKAVEEYTVLQDVVSRKLHEEEKPVGSHHIAHIESTQEVDEAADVV